MADDSELHPLAQAQIQAHDALAPKVAAEQRQYLEDALHGAEAVFAPLLAPIVQRILDNPHATDAIKALATEAGFPEHQFGAIIGGIAIGAILGPAFGAALQPELDGISQQSWKLTPIRALSPDLLAAAALKGVKFPADPFSIPAGLEAEAALSGISADRLNAMAQTAGQSIGLAEALLLERRNQWVNATIDEALAYSNMNPKFYASAKNLKFGPPSVGEAITGALKGHLPDLEARKLVNEAGIDEAAHYDWLLASAGRPPGIEQMLELWNKAAAGLPGFTVTQADVEAAVRQSDINDAFLPFVLQLRHYFPPPRSIVPMIRSGAITDTDAGQLLDAYGVGDPWKSALIAEGHATKTGAAKELTQAQAVRMYEAGLIARTDANARLLALHYPQADVDLFLNYADNARKEALTNATIRSVGTRYVAHKIPLVDVQTLLTRAGVPTSAQNDLVTLWDIERTANVHIPSPAAVVGAGRRQEITPLEVKTRLNQAGIADTDLAIFVADGWPPGQALAGQAAAHAVVAGLTAWPGAAGGPIPAPRRLTVVQIAQLYAAGTIGKAEATADLEALGYSPTIAAELVTTFTPHNPPIP